MPPVQIKRIYEPPKKVRRITSARRRSLAARRHKKGCGARSLDEGGGTIHRAPQVVQP